jgi:hypothetical protein
MRSLRGLLAADLAAAVRADHADAGAVGAQLAVIEVAGGRRGLGLFFVVLVLLVALVLVVVVVVVGLVVVGLVGLVGLVVVGLVVVGLVGLVGVGPRGLRVVVPRRRLAADLAAAVRADHADAGAVGAQPAPMPHLQLAEHRRGRRRDLVRIAGDDVVVALAPRVVTRGHEAAAPLVAPVGRDPAADLACAVWTDDSDAGAVLAELAPIPFADRHQEPPSASNRPLAT